MLALRYARRELRGGVRGLRIVLACLALGVAAIAAVGSLREGIERGLASEGRRILGGDLEVQGGAQPLPDALRRFLHDRGARLSDIVQMRSMLIASNGERQLVELKAVDPAYPLVGAAEIDAGALAAVLAERDGLPGLVADPVIVERLGVKPGATVRLGQATFVLRGALLREPDRVAGPAILGPRVMISQAALPSTGLVQPGSLLNYELRAVLPAGADPAATAAAIRAHFPGTGWRIRLAGEAAPGIGRFVDQTALFLTLVGLTALLVGGIGVATGVRAWLEARARSIATLRCLGASSRTIFAVYLLQVLVLSAWRDRRRRRRRGRADRGGGCGVRRRAAGAAADGALPGAAALAACYGLLTAGAFALWPLGAGGADSRRGAVSRRAAPLEAARAAEAAAGERGARLGAGGLIVATSPERGSPPVLRGGVGDLAAVLGRRLGADRSVAACAGAARGLGPARRRQPAPARRIDRADAGLARARALHAGRGRADPGQYPRRGARPASGRRAQLLLHRRPERRAGPLPGNSGAAAGRRARSTRCRACAPASCAWTGSRPSR